MRLTVFLPDKVQKRRIFQKMILVNVSQEFSHGKDESEEDKLV